jgi:hypothetical protein
MTGPAHSFVVLAHGESPYLTACLESLVAQAVPSPIVLATSTPSDRLEALAARFGAALRVNPVRAGIAADWTFGLRQAQTPVVTLAHQDDLYLPGYTEACLRALVRAPDSLIVFTDYLEQVGDRLRSSTLNLRLKRAMLAGCYGWTRTLRGRWSRRISLSLGCPIPCPTVVYNRAAIGDFAFSDAYTVNMDWDAWVRLAELPGAFTRVPSPLVVHRIHAHSATSAALAADRRRQEDRRMFGRLWPHPAARLLSTVYALSYASNHAHAGEAVVAEATREGGARR